MLLDKKDLKVYKDKKLIIKGTRYKLDRLYDISIKSKVIQGNYIILSVIVSLYYEQYNNKNQSIRKVRPNSANK